MGSNRGFNNNKLNHPKKETTMSRVLFVRIEMSNDAMQTSFDVAEALRSIAERFVNNDYVEFGDEVVRGIHDENGNTVGEWKLTT